jgi:hypothetical protein
LSTVAISLDNENSLNELGKDLKIDVSGFSETKIQDLVERMKLGDIEGASAITKVSRNHALQAIRAFYEKSSAGQTVRKMLRTPDSRRLAKDILVIFSKEASSPVARDGISVFDLRQSMPRDLLRQSLEVWTLGMKALEEVESTSRLDRLKTLLSGIELHAKVTKNAVDSDTISYFASRRKPLETILAISTEFANSNSISVLLDGVDLAVIKEVIRLLDGLARLQIPDAYAIISDVELAINERLQKGKRDQYGAKTIIENQVNDIATTLKMNLNEQNKLMKAVLENLAFPVELNSRSVRSVIETWKSRLSSEQAGKVSKTEAELKKYWKTVSLAVEKIVRLDQMIAVATTMRKFSLGIPVIGTGGIGFVNGQNMMLSQEAGSKIIPITYSVGKTISVKVVAPARNVVMLTGANSGGKTTLLTTVATIHVLTLMGLPVPAESAEVNPVPIYLFRKRTTKRVGSLEQALRSLIPVFAERQSKLILIDEFEALTEPGAAGRIVASIINHVATGSSSILLVTHLATEILPHVKLPIRVDGIEAVGIDNQSGDLIVERQPVFNHIGSSTPQHIINKLSRTSAARSRNAKQITSLYGEILASLSEESERGLQAPLNFPWISGEK